MSMDRADDPSALSMGTLISTDIPYRDEPYGLLTRFQYERGCVCWLYTSEHTDLDALVDAFGHVPVGAGLGWQRRCPAVPEFKHVANSVIVHQLFSAEGEEPVARISPEKLFATEIMVELR